MHTYILEELKQSKTLEQQQLPVDDAHDTDAVMPMYNLIEYSDTYLKISGSLRQHYRDEPV